MFFQAYKAPAILLFAVLAANQAFANEEAAAPKEEKPVVRSSEESFAVVQARVSGLEAKVHSAEAEIQRLILEKQKTKDPVQSKELIKQMLTIHKDLEKNLKEYDQQRALLKYRYPEKGQQEKREYERIDLKSIEQMENQMSISSSLKKTMKKVRSQYEDPADKAKKKQAQTTEEQHAQEPPAAPAPSLIDPVIIKK